MHAHKPKFWLYLRICFDLSLLLSFFLCLSSILAVFCSLYSLFLYRIVASQLIFYFISNFLLYAPILPNREPKTSAFRNVFVLEQFFSYSMVVSVAKANVLQTQTIAVFAPNWSRADPNIAPFKWRIWLALSGFFCLSECHVCYPFLALNYIFFCTVLPKNCISLSQSQSNVYF